MSLKSPLSPHQPWWPALSAALVCLLALVSFQAYLFGNALYIFKDIGSDTITTFWPQYYHIADYLSQEGLPTWSFAQGMGQNIFAFSVSDPFLCLLYLFGKEGLAQGIAWIEALKLALAAWFFYAFLLQRNLNPLAALAGGLCFGFSGFMLIGSAWYVFSVEGVYLALLLLAFERSLKKDYLLFGLSIALIAAAQPVNLLPMGLFMLPYALIRYLETQGQTPQGQTLGFKWLLSLVALGLLGLVISSFWLGNALVMLAQSPRVGGESSMFNQLLADPVFNTASPWQRITALARLFHNGLLGNGSNFTGWHNYLEAPALYAGLGSLILLPQYFTQKANDKRWLYALWLGFFLLALIFPFFRRLFFGFSGDYYRLFGLLFSTVLIIPAATAWSQILDNKAKINLPALALSLVALLFLLFQIKNGNYTTDKKLQTPIKVQNSLQALIAAILILHAALLFIAQLLSEHKKPLLSYATLGLFIFELGFFAIQTNSNRPTILKEELSQKIGYNDYTRDALAKIRSQDQGFFRLSKNYASGVAVHASMNDAKIQGYFSTASYASFNQKYYIEFLSALGAIDPKDENQTRWSPGLEARPLLQHWASTKYRLLKGQINEEQMQGLGFNKLDQIGDISIYQNPQALPLGFSYRYQIKPSTLLALNPVQRDIALLQAVCLPENTPSQLPFLPSDSLFSPENYSPQRLAWHSQDLSQEALKITNFSNKNIKGQVSLSQTKFVFFTIPYDQGWELRVNGQPQTPQLANIGFWGLELPAGQHELELQYRLPYFAPSLWLSVLGFALWGLYGIWSSRDKKPLEV